MRRSPFDISPQLRRESLLSSLEPALPAHAERLPLSVTLERLRDREALGEEWRALEASAEGSYFTSWAWIHNWLLTLPGGIELWVLKASRAGLGVGLALLARHERRVAGLVACEGWWLHATGRPECDVIFIEHNDFLVHAGDGPRIRRAMVDAWRKQSDDRAELNLPGVRQSDWSFLSTLTLGQRHAPRSSFALDASPQGAAVPEDHTVLLGSHTRRMVRRSRKEYEKRGPITVAEARTTDEALDWFAALLRLNADRLEDKGGRSDCLAPHFRRFHAHLLGRAAPGARMVRVDAGGVPFAYLYAFVHRDRAYVYQSGFDFSDPSNNARPGYVGHCMTAAVWARQGITVYDFMAGDARYKENLSNRQDPLDWIVLHKRHWSHALEDRWLQLRKSRLVQTLKLAVRHKTA